MKTYATKVYKMGMNRKWNMKIFELHESDADVVPSVDETETSDNVFVDTTTTAISMKKYPFSAESAFGENVSSDDILTINVNSLTADTDFSTNITNIRNWHFKEGVSSRMVVTTEDDTIFKFMSVVKTFYDIPTESTRWLLKFDLKSDPTSFRNFVYFDGADDSATSVNYAYGIDIPSTGYPRLEHITDYDKFETERIEDTIADEQYFTGQNYMPVMICRWDNIYTIYYDNRYMITVPVDEGSLNRIGVWTWSGATTFIKNPTLYIIDDDSEKSYVFITSEEATAQTGVNEPTMGEPKEDQTNNTNEPPANSNP